MTIHKIMKTCNKITSSLSDALGARLDMGQVITCYLFWRFVLRYCSNDVIRFLPIANSPMCIFTQQRHLRVILKCQNEDKQRLPRTPRGHRHSVTVHQGRLTRIYADIQGKVIRQKCHSTLHKFKSNRYLPWCNSKLNFRPSQDWPGPS